MACAAARYATACISCGPTLTINIVLDLAVRSGMQSFNVKICIALGIYR